MLSAERGTLSAQQMTTTVLPTVLPFCQAQCYGPYYHFHKLLEKG